MTNDRKLLLAWYGGTVFVSSALLLVLEIVAGRLLAPYVGVSLYSWTSIIGVILAGLSLGNWLGGRLADRGAGHGAAGWVLLTGALACLAILALLILAAELLQTRSLSLMSASLLYAATLFFAPALLLGVITPLLTTLALHLDERRGRIIGGMHALAALGSIAGTFAAGYWLIQTFGSKNIVVGATVVLLLLALPFFISSARTRTAACLVTVVVGAALITMVTGLQGFDTPCDHESNYYCIRTVDERDATGALYGRSLILDHMSHSTNHRDDPARLLVPYVAGMQALIRHWFGPTDTVSLRYFFAGGGAYTQPRAIAATEPLASITVVELDPAVTRIAVDSLFLEVADIDIRHGDARNVLQRTAGPFDVVVTDVFHDLAVPYHLTTLEFAELVKSRLTPQGLYLLNVVDMFPDAKLVKAMIKTLRERFRNVDAWLHRIPESTTRLTYVLSASDAHVAPDLIVAQQGPPPQWLRVTEPLLTSGTPVRQLPLLTDSLAPVERLVAPLFMSTAGR